MNTTQDLWNDTRHIMGRWKDRVTRMCAERGLYRSRTRVISGVCGGLAHRLHVPTIVVRLAFVLLFFTGVIHAVLLYAILAAVMPQEPADITDY